MAERLDIVVVTGEYPPAIGGVGDYTRQLARALIAKGHWISVLCPASTEHEPEPDEPTIISSGPAWNWQTLRRALRIAQGLAPTLVHIQYQTGAYGMHPAINLLPELLRRLPSRPWIVVTAHDLRLPYLFPKADLLRTWLTRRLFEAADAVIVTNEADERRLRGREPADRRLFSPRAGIRPPVYRIPIGSNIPLAPPADFDRATWRAQQGLAPDDVLVGYFGLLSRTKGVLELVQALATLPSRFKLLIIGGAAPLPDDERYAAEVQSCIAAHGLSERVKITGPCSEAEVSGWLMATDLVALPFHDGASFRRGSLLAALAHGVPVVTTTPAARLDPPLVGDVHALLVSPSQAVELRTALERVAADAALRERLAVEGPALAAKFSWPDIAAHHETVYHTLVTVGSTGGSRTHGESGASKGAELRQ